MTSAERYAKSVFRKLYELGPMTRTTLMQELKMRQNSIVDICNRLEKKRLVLKEDDKRRRNVPIFLNETKFAVVGVEHARDRIQCVLLNGQAVKLASETYPIERALSGEDRIKEICRIIREFIKQHKHGRRIVGIGVADIGIVDTERGVSVYSVHTDGWQNLPLAEILRNEFGVFTRLVDRSGAGAFCNCIRHPAKRSLRDSIQLWIANGIGASILHNGKFWGTGVPSACQIGHTIIQENGPVCRCGNRGCLEAIASIPAILREAEEVCGKKIGNAAELLHLAEKGDTRVQAVMQRAANALGIALANTVTFTAITNIFIRSELCEGSNLFLNMISPVLKKNLITPFRDITKLASCSMEPDCSAEGAALFVQKEFFSEANTDPVPEVAK